MNESSWKTPGKRDYRGYETLDELLLDYIATGRAKNKTEARRLALREIPKESYYQGRILRMLETEFQDGRWRKNAAGIGQVGGEPDILGCCHGLFVAVECKRPLVGVESELQKKAVREIRQAGGFAMFAVYPEEVYDALCKWMFVGGG